MEKENVKLGANKLVKGSLEMFTACFDEYYFVIPEGVIRPHPGDARIYHICDVVPVKGETYNYPRDFNIIDLHFNLVACIRNAIFEDLIPLANFIYDGYPAFNMMGFSIKLNSQNDFDNFKSHYKTFSLTKREKLAEFANKWFEIIKFRNIKYR